MSLPGSFQQQRTLSDLRTDVEPVQDEVARALASRGYDTAAAFAIRLALEEALVNAFRHGNRSDPTKRVHLTASIDSRQALTAVPDPTEEENLEIPSGRGIMLMRAYMSEVEYLPPGNILRMVYRRDDPTGPVGPGSPPKA
jgi:serine/threonine-protein kinase RsbW